MNRLIADPGLLRCPVEEASTTHTSQYESKLDAMLSEQPVDDTAAKKLILQLAAAEYEKLSNGEYETQRLRSIFERLSPIRELTAELLTQTISSIEVRRDNGVSIRLKNSQIIRGGIQECRSRKKN